MYTVDYTQHLLFRTNIILIVFCSVYFIVTVAQLNLDFLILHHFHFVILLD